MMKQIKSSTELSVVNICRNLAFIIIFAFTPLLSFPQKLYTKTDSIAITEDSVKLNLVKYRGAIQWQHSINGINWESIQDKNDSILKIKSSEEGFYRASISDNSCNPVFSDTAMIIGEKSSNSMISDPNKILGANFVGRKDNTFMFIGSSTDIPINTVFIDNNLASDIRVVKNVGINGDTIKVITEPGSMEDVFTNADFKLTTEPSSDNSNMIGLRSGIIKHDSNIDTDGFIHPSEIVNNYGVSLRDATMTNDKTPFVYFNKDLSGKQIFNKNGLSLTIDEGYFTFSSEIKCEFKFDQDNFKWGVIPTGKLKKIKFYTDLNKTYVDAKIILKAQANKEGSCDEEFAMIPDLFKSSFKFMVGPVPVWMDVKIDLMARYRAKFEATASVSGGISAKTNISIGASYEYGTWTPIADHSQSFSSHGPKITGQANYDITLDFYPRVSIIFYKLLGPYLDISPFLKETLNYSISHNSDFELSAGINGRIGCSGNFASEDEFNYSKELELTRNSLYKTPKTLSIISGKDQSGNPGKELENPLVFKVTDSDGYIVNGCPVHIKAYTGTIDNNSPRTGSDGLVSVKWMMPESKTGDCMLEAWLENGKDNKIDESIVFVKANVSAGLPTVTTSAVTNISKTSATCGGEVTDDGGATVTAKGICWNTAGNPTISNYKTIDGYNTGSFVSNITGLTPNTTYFVRAYATNKQGTAYGDEYYFKTINDTVTVETGEATLIEKYYKDTMINNLRHRYYFYFTYQIKLTGSNNISEFGIESFIDKYPFTHSVKVKEGITTIWHRVYSIYNSFSFTYRAYAKLKDGRYLYGEYKSVNYSLPPLSSSSLEVQSLNEKNISGDSSGIIDKRLYHIETITQNEE